MQIRQVNYRKEFKVGLPNYSNITVSMEMTVELQNDEKPNHNAIWDEINQQIFIQTDLDPSWIKTHELRDYHKLVIKVPKQ